MIRRLLKLVISIGCRLLDGCRRRAGGRRSRAPVILYYHALPADQVAAFARQLAILRETAQPVPLAEAVGADDPSGLVAVTFDDGFASVLDNALPVLSSLAIPATIFVVTSFLGRPPGWREHGERVPAGDRLLDLDELRALAGDGLFTVGSHSVSHPDLTTLTPEAAQREIVESKAFLEKLLGRPVYYLSFPYGAFASQHVALAERAGYRKVLATTLPCRDALVAGHLVANRIHVAPTDWPVEFRLKLLGAYRWLPAAVAAKRRMLALIGARGSRRALRTPPEVGAPLERNGHGIR